MTYMCSFLRSEIPFGSLTAIEGISWHKLGMPFFVLIVLLDVLISTVEEVLLLVKLVLQQRFAQSLLHLAISSNRLLPAGEAHDTHDLIDIIHNAFDHDRGVAGAHFVEQFGQSSLPFILFLWSFDLFFCLDDFFGDFEQLFDEGQVD
jgi:hypothetical protein